MVDSNILGFLQLVKKALVGISFTWQRTCVWSCCWQILEGLFLSKCLGPWSVIFQMPLGGEIRCIRMWLCLFFTWISLLESLGICCIKDIYENIALGYSLKGSNVGQGQMKGRQAGDSGLRECWESPRSGYPFWCTALKQNSRVSNIQQSHFHFRGLFVYCCSWMFIISEIAKHDQD